MQNLSSLLKKIIEPFAADSLLLCLFIKAPQIVVGYLLAFYFGKHSFGVPWSPGHLNLSFFEVAPWFLDVVSNFYEPIRSFPYAFALFSGLTKIVGGICLILGFLSRIASFCIILLMTIFLINQDFIEFNFTFPLFFIAVSCFSLYFGSGKFGLDYLLSKKLFNN